MKTVITEDTLEARIEEIKWEAVETGWNMELKRKLTYYTMLDELARRLIDIDEL